MTATDVMSMSQVQLQTSESNLTAKAEKAIEVTDYAFSNLMNQLQSPTASNDECDSLREAVSQTGENSTTSFEKYQSKDNGSRVAKSEEASASPEDLEKEKESIDSMKQELVSAVAKACGVSEEDVVNAMEALGLNFMDLLNPSDLGSLFMELTDQSDMAVLLVNEEFLNLMNQVQETVTSCMETLQVDQEKLMDLVSMMEVLEEPESLDPSFEKALKMEGLQPLDENAAPSEGQADEIVAFEVEEKAVKAVQKEENILPVEKPKVESLEEPEEKPLEEIQSDVLSEKSPVKKGFSQSEGNSKEHEETFTGQATATTAGQTDNQVTMTSTTSFTQTVDMMEMIEKLAENVKAIISSESQTMEMQLNPENLGKLFLQVTQKEGAVSAQITAQNEDVKEALIAQVATLQDKLSQAGIKVTAIEVTVETHEFEQNLEQNEHRRENEAFEQNTSKRRNLNLNDLDSLQGLMSEEEALVAQIMKDNGNSVDLTA